MPETYAFDLGRYLSYDEFYYKDFRVQKLLMDAQTGSIMEWRWENKQEELELFLHHHPNVIMYEQEIPTIRLAVIINNKVITSANMEKRSRCVSCISCGDKWKIGNRTSKLCHSDHRTFGRKAK